MKQILLLMAVLLLSASLAFGQGAAVSVDHIDGLWTDTDGDVGPAGASYLNPGPVTYYIRYANHTGGGAAGMTNGFVIYGPPSFYPATGAEVAFGGGSYLSDYFSLVAHVGTFSCDGLGADTIGFSYSGMLEILPDGFDEVVAAIYTGCDTEGETLCLDSSFYGQLGDWLWGPGGVPDWDGPHCYELKTCCTKRGDIDFDGTPVTIADIVYLVQYMFQFGPPPPCLGNVDWNGSGGNPDVSDLIGLVAFMFQGGTPAVPCF